LKSLRERARDLRGEMTVDSKPGAGTTVTLRAPL
jgi:signal transduction histidine kinase